jgi:hypothetical protein
MTRAIFDPELIPLLKQSFGAHMRWVIPKIRDENDRMWAENMAMKIDKNLDNGVDDPTAISKALVYEGNPAGKKVWEEYCQIRGGIAERFSGGLRSSDPVEKL